MGDIDEKYGRRRRYPSLVWPVLLITAGVIFLLGNLGVLHVNFWGLWRLWPALLILIGLDILFGRRSLVGNLIVLLLTLAFVAGIILLLFAAPDLLGPTTSGSVDRIAEPLDGIELAALAVDFEAGDLTVGRLVDSSSLIEGDLDLATERKPTWDIERSGDRANMTLQYRQSRRFEDWNWGRGEEWHLRLSPQAVWSLIVDVGAGGATLDLGGLLIRDLVVDAGAGRTVVTLPETGDFSASVDGGVGELVVEIPRAMAARVRVDRGLAALTLPPRFELRGDVYVTEGWDTSDDRVDLEIDVGVGLVTIREP